MRNRALAAAAFASVALAAPGAHADMVGAAVGGGTGLVIAGPPGAVAGIVVGGVFGKPFWGPPIFRGGCWTDNNFHRHCSKHYSGR
jgi:hypothetical protein